MPNRTTSIQNARRTMPNACCSRSSRSTNPVHRVHNKWMNRKRWMNCQTISNNNSTIPPVCAKYISLYNQCPYILSYPILPQSRYIEPLSRLVYGGFGSRVHESQAQLGIVATMSDDEGTTHDGHHHLGKRFLFNGLRSEIRENWGLGMEGDTSRLMRRI